MRVAVNAEQLLQPSPGGIGRYTARLVTLLPTGARADEVLPFVARHSSAEIGRAWREFGLADAPGVPLPAMLPLPRPALYDAWHVLGFPPLGAQSRALSDAHVIHAPSLAVPPPGRTPLVVTVHDAAPVLFPEAFSARGRWFHRRGLAAAARRADLVITGTQAAADEIAELTAIPGERIRVVPYGVDQSTVPPEAPGAVRAYYGLGDRPFVLWVGSLEPRKGVGTLVADMAALHQRPGEAEVDLVLVGFEGWKNEGLIAEADRATLGSRLRHLGTVPDGHLAALYAAAAVFAFPSRHEGFGLPVLEAMAEGTAVVCSDIAALREVAGDAACFVAPDDVSGWTEVIGALLVDEDRRTTMAADGRRRSEGFSWQGMVEATRTVYGEATGGDR